MRYGLLRYRDTGNLGDEIQSIAARRFLPRIDRLVDRDRLDRRPGWIGDTALILNGWFSHRPRCWPPHPSIRPLLTSMHLSDQIGVGGFSAAEAWVVGPAARYLRAQGPVGARDLWTLELLRRNGVEAYFSGCLTLTLQRPDVSRGGTIIASDLDAATLAALRARVRSPVVTVTHHATTPRGFAARTRQAAALLDAYARAKLVVTTRLHAALPCLALGTPVLLLPPRADMIRLEGLTALVHHQNPVDFAAGQGDFDVNTPPPNPTRHHALATDLAARCHAFVSRCQAM